MIDVLFVCIHNSGRSQMAEAFFQALAPEGMRAESAGTQPAERIDPLVVEALREVGLDVSDKKPKALSAALVEESRRIITMGCGVAESCPAFLGLRLEEDWGLPDPAGQTLDGVRSVRDAVKDRVDDLLHRLTSA